MKEQNHPNVIKIRNAHVHNLKHINVDIPLNKIVGIAGVSGSGKSSLALGVLYAEGSREWVSHMPDALPEEMRPMAENICESFQMVAKRLMDLGLGYLSLDRAASTLSTGERQRMQLARAVRNRTTGVLYVLDEPSIGLHPSNIVGLTDVMHDLIADGVYFIC